MMKLKHVTAIFPLIGAFALFVILAPATARGAVLLAVDFNAGSGSPSPTQSGFQGFAVGTGSLTSDLSQTFTGLSPTASSGTVIVTIGRGTAGSYTARDRNTMSGSGAFASYDLYRDVVTARTLSLSGLNANTTYSFTLYAYDNSSSNTTTITDVSSGSAAGSTSVSYTADYAFDASTPSTIFASTFNVTTDSSGSLVLGISGGNINGFEISGIPETSSITLLGGGLSLLAIRRKRR